ncbi:hypothetical protein BT96DRAFT_298569 [Gymnopus androsaceus JB14]|uniref:Uncharacterized protein n=1 Tax=Gymnopus androsaceus JB14 TaxID=1447944 RepID=A0A6A4H389_9AGAR|nr:hypothetical protein BT96DRAFT_298569 [Gymnopus androsaceus JB14]
MKRPIYLKRIAYQQKSYPSDGRIGGSSTAKKKRNAHCRNLRAIMGVILYTGWLSVKW